MVTAQEVKERLRALGADLCGIAPVERFGEAPEGFHPLDVMPACRSVVVVAIEFLAATLACPSPVPYTVVRNQLSDRIDRLSVAFCEQMATLGVCAVPTGAVGPTLFDARTGRYRNCVSVKHAAQAAGLGVIGKNTLLITPEYGNMVWLAAILCDAELEADALLTEDFCGGCTVCARACPVGAVGAPEFKQMACHQHAFEGPETDEFLIRCHRCRSMCPHCLGTRNAWAKARMINEAKGAR